MGNELVVFLETNYYSYSFLKKSGRINIHFGISIRKIKANWNNLFLKNTNNFVFVSLFPEKVTLSREKVTFSDEKMTFTILKVTFSRLKVILLHINMRIIIHYPLSIIHCQLSMSLINDIDRMPTTVPSTTPTLSAQKSSHSPERVVVQ